MLKCRNFIMVVPGFPADDRPLIHCLPICQIKVGCGLKIAICPQGFGTNFCILIPKFHVLRKLIYHLRFFTVPVRVCVSVENDISHIAGSDYRTGHDSGDLLPGSGKPQNIPSKHTHPLSSLFQTPCGFRSLRVVNDHKRRTHTFAVRTLVLHPTDSTGYPCYPDDDAGCFAVFDGGQHDFIGSPGDSCAFTVTDLSGTTICDPVQLFNWITDLWKISSESLVDFQLRLNGVQHFQCCRLCCANQHDKLTVTIEHRPKCRSFSQGRFTGTSRHC